jgi:hypothetical protein
VNNSYIFPPLIPSFPVRILKDPQSGKWEARQTGLCRAGGQDLHDLVDVIAGSQVAAGNKSRITVGQLFHRAPG